MSIDCCHKRLGNDPSDDRETEQQNKSPGVFVAKNKHTPLYFLKFNHWRMKTVEQKAIAQHYPMCFRFVSTGNGATGINFRLYGLCSTPRSGHVTNTSFPPA
jgi:hypothetical protein